MQEQKSVEQSTKQEQKSGEQSTNQESEQQLQGTDENCGVSERILFGWICLRAKTSLVNHLPIVLCRYVSSYLIHSRHSFRVNELSTNGSHSYDARGFMFNVISRHPRLVVKAIHTRAYTLGSRAVSVYYRRGGFEGFECNSSAWTLAGVGTFQNTVTRGLNRLLDLHIGLAKGERVGLYFVDVSDPYTAVFTRKPHDGGFVMENQHLVTTPGQYLAVKAAEPWQSFEIGDDPVFFAGIIDYWLC